MAPAAAAGTPGAEFLLDQCLFEHVVRLEADVARLAPAVSRAATIGGREPRRTYLRVAHDLRQPRPPRHRSERPSTGLAVVGDVLMERLLEFLDDLGAVRFVGTPPDSIPLAGHPLQLLRPPAALG